MSVRLAKKRANYRANRKLRRAILSRHSSAVLVPYDLGSLEADKSEKLSYEVAKRHRFTEEWYDAFCNEWEKSAWSFEEGLGNLAFRLKLRSHSWDNLAGFIYQIMNKTSDVYLIRLCIEADHRDVWKSFDWTMLSRHEWKEAEQELRKLLAK